MKVTKFLSVLALAGFAATGCDDASSDGDGGAKDGAVSVSDGGAKDAAGDAIMLWGLSRNANCYAITTVANVVDGCMLGVAGLVGTSLPSNYDEATKTFSLGRTVGSPAQPSLGSGVVQSNAATLARANTVTDGTCTWTQMNTSQFLLTNHDTFTLTAREDESGFSAGCGTDVPAGGMCTSTWTWTFNKTACPSPDGGAHD